MAAVLIRSFSIVFAAIASGARGSHESLRAGVSTLSDAAAAALPAGVVDEKYRLRVCNAYAWPTGLRVFRGLPPVELTDTPVDYKRCTDLLVPLQEGDDLDFRTGGLTVGNFAITSLPPVSSSLLLVPHRQDNQTAAVAFDSHIFSNIQSPQIAVVDAYRGPGHSILQIADSTQRDELACGTVIAVPPGIYEVALAGADGAMRTKKALGVQPQGVYVVMRVGAVGSPDPAALGFVGAGSGLVSQGGKATTGLLSLWGLLAHAAPGLAGAAPGGAADFPEELVVFPQQSAARRCASFGIVIHIGLRALWLL